MTLPASKPQLVLRGLRKLYREVAAVDHLDLSVAAGEYVVLVGPSGCGKTTILRMIAGLEEPTAGRVELGGRDISSLPPGERDVAMVFQSYALFPHLSVKGNLSLGLPPVRLSRGERDRRVTEAAATLGLEPLLDRYPAELSGGERQRVALGRGLLREPKVFLLDEPLSNLDPELRSTLRVELLGLHRRLESATIHVTHDQTEAMTLGGTLGGRLAVILAGKVEQAGTPVEIYENPRTAFVARFLGNPGMNLLRGPIRAKGEGAVVLLAGAEVEVPAQVRGHLPAGGEVLAGLRPEALSIVPRQAARIRGRAEIVEMLGRERLIHIGIEHGGRTVLVQALGGERPAMAGDELGLDFDDRSVHLFDAGSGLSLRAR